MDLTQISILAHEVVDSTQDEAARQVAAGRVPPFLVMAEVQTKGRGRQGKAWETPRGNFAATLALPLSVDAQAGDYSFIVALGIFRAVKALVPPQTDLCLKWPNDVLLAGKKCAGILLERPEPGLLLVGTGVNLASSPLDRAALADVLSPAPSPESFAQAYLRHLGEVITAYHTSGLGSLLVEWQAHGFPLGQAMTVNLPGESFAAFYEGLAADGALRARMPDGSIRLIHAGEVFFG